MSFKWEFMPDGMQAAAETDKLSVFVSVKPSSLATSTLAMNGVDVLLQTLSDISSMFLVMYVRS